MKQGLWLLIRCNKNAKLELFELCPCWSDNYLYLTVYHQINIWDDVIIIKVNYDKNYWFCIYLLFLTSIKFWVWVCMHNTSLYFYYYFCEWLEVLMIIDNKTIIKKYILKMVFCHLYWLIQKGETFILILFFLLFRFQLIWRWNKYHL